MSPEEIRLMWETDPFAVAGKYSFFAGVVGLYLLCVFRQKMSYVDAAMALIGLKPVSNRDWLFNLFHVGVIALVLALVGVAVQRNLSGGA